MTKLEFANAAIHRLQMPEGKHKPTLTMTVRIMEAVFEQLTAVLKEGGEQRIAGFGTFSTKAIKARNYRNPQTGAMTLSQSRTRAAFKPAMALKLALAPETPPPRGTGTSAASRRAKTRPAGPPARQARKTAAAPRSRPTAG